MFFSALLQSQKHGRGRVIGIGSSSTRRLLSLSSAPVPRLSCHYHLRRTRTRESEIWTLNGVCDSRRSYRTASSSDVRPLEGGEGEGEDKRFKVLFMGRDEFSCLVLQQLYEAKDVWKEIVIATQPDVHVGRRGSVLSISPLKILGEKLDLPVFTIPKARKDFKMWELPPPFSLVSPATSTPATSPATSPPTQPPPTPPPPPTHLLLTASFGRILPTRMLSSFPPTHRLNVHPSLLPLYRGPAPIQWTVVNGDRESGVCVLEMLRAGAGAGKGGGVDAGCVWGCEKVSVPTDATFESLRDELAVLGGKLLVNVLRDFMNDKAVCRPQAQLPLIGGEAPRAPMISAQDALVDFNTMSAEDVWRRFRGIGHQKPLYTHAPDGKTLQLIELAPLPSSSSSPSSPSPSPSPPLPPTLTSLPPTPGSTLLDKKSDTLLVRCAGGTVLSVGKVKPEGKGVRKAGEWWTGLRVVKQRGMGTGGSGGGGTGVVLGGGFGGGLGGGGGGD